MTSSILSPTVRKTLPCAANPELFFARHLSEVHAAQRICAACPLLAECAETSQRLQLWGCVVASVWIEDEARAGIACQELAEVAETSEPVALVEADRAPKGRVVKYDDPEFQERIVDLYTAGVSWLRISVHMNAGYETVRRAYFAATGESPKVYRKAACGQALADSVVTR